MDDSTPNQSFLERLSAIIRDEMTSPAEIQQPEPGEPPPVAVEPPPKEEPPATGLSDLELQAAVERLSEDERLRGDLTDTVFSEVLGFAVDIVMRASSPAVIEGMRPLVRALSASAGDGDTGRLVAAVRSVFGDRIAAHLDAELAAAPQSTDPDQNAVTYLASLRRSL